MKKEKSICDDCATGNCLWRTSTGGLDQPVKSCDCFTAKPTTNADRIRAMNNDELAEWLVVVETAILEKQPKLDHSALKDDWLEWLKQEAFTWLD